MHVRPSKPTLMAMGVGLAWFANSMSTAVACMALALCCLTVFYGRVVCLPTDEQRQGGYGREVSCW